jgi:proteic killer suppression protein
MLASFRHRGLKEFWERGRSAKQRPDLARRIRDRLGVMEQATKQDDFRVPGFDFHALHGRPIRYSIHVNGPWCITFEWDGRDVWRVDLDQYH